MPEQGTAGDPGQPVAPVPAAHPVDDDDILGLRVLVLLLLAGLAFLTFQKGFGDFQYQLADLKEDPLYLRGPQFPIAAGLVLSGLLVLAALVARVIRELGTARPALPRRRAVWHWWWLLVAGWLGYAAGGIAAYATGGPVIHPGTMTLELGSPLHGSVTVPATCTSAPGRPALIVSVAGDGPGLPVLRLANGATGAPLGQAPGFVPIETVTRSDGGTGPAIEGLPERTPVKQLGSGAYGGLRSGRFVTLRPMTFLESYVYQPAGATVSDAGGAARYTAVRTYAPWEVDGLIPGDPWPASYPLTVTWSCDLAAVVATASPAPPATAPAGTFAARTPAPGGTPRPDGAVPVEIQVVTDGTEASVEIGGAAVASADPPFIEGRATASTDGGILRVAQAAAGARAGRVVGATFRLALQGVSSGEPVTLTIAGTPKAGASGSPGARVAVTVLNLAGTEPVPVFANIGTSADQPGWPIVLDGGLIVEPVAVEQLP